MASEFLTAGIDHSPRIAPGEYEAHCIAAHEPFEYKQFNRMVKRFDFVIHGSGEVLKKYVNLGPVDAPWKTISSRSEYYRLWTASMGRKPRPGEPLSLDHIVGNPAVQFTVSVEDKQHSDGYTYSVIGKVRRLVLSGSENEPEYYSVTQSLNNSISQSLNNSVPQSLNSSRTQELSLSRTQGFRDSASSGTQDGNANKPLGAEEAVDSGTQDVGRVESQALKDSGSSGIQDEAPKPKPINIYVLPVAGDSWIQVKIKELQPEFPGVDVRGIVEAFRAELLADRSRCRSEAGTRAEIHSRLSAVLGVAA
jgi:hypothetical protein